MAKQRAEVLKQYDNILKVGDEREIPQRSFDSTIARYCEDNDCDLLTMAKNAFIHYFEAGTKTQQISQFAWYKRGDRLVYRIQIIE